MPRTARKRKQTSQEVKQLFNDVTFVFFAPNLNLVRVSRLMALMGLHHISQSTGIQLILSFTRWSWTSDPASNAFLLLLRLLSGGLSHWTFFRTRLATSVALPMQRPSITQFYDLFSISPWIFGFEHVLRRKSSRGRNELFFHETMVVSNRMWSW